MTFNPICVALSHIIEDTKAKCSLPLALLDKTGYFTFFKAADLNESHKAPISDF